MPLNPRKILGIILDESASIEERCDGYKEEFFEVMTEIIDYERKNLAQGTNIQQKINDKCNAAGDFLARKRGQAKTSEEVVR